MPSLNNTGSTSLLILPGKDVSFDTTNISITNGNTIIYSTQTDINNYAKNNGGIIINKIGPGIMKVSMNINFANNTPNNATTLNYTSGNPYNITGINNYLYQPADASTNSCNLLYIYKNKNK